MNTAINSTTSTVPTDAQTKQLFYGTKTQYTADFTVLSTESGAIKELTMLTTTSMKEATLPDSPDDGFLLTLINNSFYGMLAKPASGSTDQVWTPHNGQGYGIELVEPGTTVVLRYCDTNSMWDVMQKVGGQVRIEGLVFDEPMIGQSIYGEATSPRASVDKTERHQGLLYNSIFQASNSAFGPTAWRFSGTDTYVGYPESSDWDIFATQSGAKTVSFWMYLDAAGGTEYLLNQYEDTNNYWTLYKNTSDKLGIVYRRGGSNEILMTGGTLSASTWHHCAMIIVGTSVAGYLDGTQISYNNAWTADSFTGGLTLGAYNLTIYFEGRMQSLFIAHNNPYNASPNVGKTDTITVPAAPMNLVM